MQARRRRPKFFTHTISPRENLGKFNFLLFFSILFFIGMITGKALGLEIAAEEGTALSTFLSPLKLISSVGEEKGFVVFLTQEILIFLSFILGFSPIMQLPLLFLIFYEGLGYGLHCAYLAQGGTKSIVFYIIIVLAPKMFCAVIIFFISVKESILYSLNYFRFLFSRLDGRDMPVLTVRYLIKFMALTVINLAYTGLVMVLSFIYCKLF